ncbi:hypothetical protein FRACA_4510003 [Frankia canadensis]|uniref:Uncharacterized protein n=1 Tax=Frankia canadensis TaxID=1836972 RepID=A0A2I2KXL4_9ACTN|nr:hypothetical protein [Frankia canadensis]SNQ50403.1 hypothetical protein FRACA_4510003 [Frankia canadensis]SOU57693.1 hypothetical protein FRACA_4510003 [Frankia canadensis]
MCPENAGPIKSACLADLGQRENALTTSTEAVTLYQDLYRRHPRAFAAELIRSLANSGERLRGAGQTGRLVRGLVQALGVASSHQIDDFDAWIVSLLRDERREQPDVFDAAWREIAGTPVPDGLDPDPADG